MSSLALLSYSVEGYTFITIQTWLNNDPFANMFAHLVPE